MPSTVSAIHPKTTGWNFDNSYTTLPQVFFSAARPAVIADPELVIFNAPLAEALNLPLSETAPAELAAIFSGNVLPAGAQPIAQAYAGHQFGHFTMLGDGRAILIGEQLTPAGGRFDIQLKGAGQTAYSRRGDGRAALGPMLREYIISEALHALGIPTTRSLAVVATHEPVYRENILPGAVLTRVAASHIRVGTFEYASALVHQEQKPEILQTLADYTIARHYPQVQENENKYLAFFTAVAENQAQLIAKWQLVGFIHGVMNTDNMALSGEAIDFGPCAFMDAYDPATVFSSIDQQGRYAYGNQPRIASWNLSRFAETLLPLIAADEAHAIELAQQAIGEFGARFNHHWLHGMRAKLGLAQAEESDGELAMDILGLMQRHRADYTSTFRALGAEANAPDSFFHQPDFQAWSKRWHERIAREGQTIVEAQKLMRATNPAVIPRNHKVEEALTAAGAGDLSVLQNLLAAVTRPFEETPANAAYRQGAPAEAGVYRTFCGT
ncbi:MAG: YdiU family protein [Turneriella sp.]|nr:YdiU family protein [Turneriella sp.]